MCPSGFQEVVTFATSHHFVTDKNVCFHFEALIASIAICKSPVVPFLKPTGIESHETNFLCS
jgi:hypothetical protein